MTEMPIVCGEVESVQLDPGRAGLVSIRLRGKDTPEDFSLDPAYSTVTCDGVLAGVAEFVLWLLTPHRRCTVKLHPSGHRYGLSLRTEFTTIESKP